MGDKTENSVTNVQSLAKALSVLTVADLVELTEQLRLQWKVDQMPTVAAASQPAEVTGHSDVEEKPTESKSIFDVKISGFSDSVPNDERTKNRASAIKLIKETLREGGSEVSIMEAKTMLEESAQGGKIVRSKLDKETANVLKKKFSDLGIMVSLV